MSLQLQHGRPVYNCDVEGCGFAARSLEGMQRHAFTTRHSSFPCTVCHHRHFVDYRTLELHIRTVHKRTHHTHALSAELCRTCCAEFADFDTLVAHGRAAGHFSLVCLESGCRVPDPPVEVANNQSCMVSHIQVFEEHLVRFHVW